MTQKITEPEFDADLELQEVGENVYQDNTVFIKEDLQNGKCFWGIYDAEGNRMAVTENRDCAFVVARQNDFEPCSVH